MYYNYWPLTQISWLRLVIQFFCFYIMIYSHVLWISFISSFFPCHFSAFACPRENDLFPAGESFLTSCNWLETTQIVPRIKPSTVIQILFKRKKRKHTHVQECEGGHTASKLSIYLFRDFEFASIKQMHFLSPDLQMALSHPFLFFQLP